MFWDDILQEIKKRKDGGQTTNLLNDEKQKTFYKTKKDELPIKSLVRYRLGAKYGNIYLTKREAECMVWLLRGKTTSNIATILELSSRTVESYIKNMKTKTGCRTKSELIDLINASEFTKHVDF